MPTSSAETREREAVVQYSEDWAAKFERIAKACASGAGDGAAFQMCADYLRENARTLREEAKRTPSPSENAGGGARCAECNDVGEVLIVGEWAPCRTCRPRTPEKRFDPHTYCAGIFDRLERFTPDQRAHLFGALETRWCWDCGLDQDECVGHPPEPSGAANRMASHANARDCTEPSGAGGLETVARWLYGKSGMGAPIPMWSSLSDERRDRHRERAAEWLEEHRSLLRALLHDPDGGA